MTQSAAAHANRRLTPRRPAKGRIKVVFHKRLPQRAFLELSREPSAGA